MRGDATGSLAVPVVYTSLTDGSTQSIGTVAFADVPPGQSSTQSLAWTPAGPVAPGRLEANTEGRGVTVEWDQDQGPGDGGVQPAPADAGVPTDQGDQADQPDASAL
jgi:hypothetical protein